MHGLPLGRAHGLVVVVADGLVVVVVGFAVVLVVGGGLVVVAGLGAGPGVTGAGVVVTVVRAAGTGGTASVTGPGPGAGDGPGRTGAAGDGVPGGIGTGSWRSSFPKGIGGRLFTWGDDSASGSPFGACPGPGAADRLMSPSNARPGTFSTSRRRSDTRSWVVSTSGMVAWSSWWKARTNRRPTRSVRVVWPLPGGGYAPRRLVVTPTPGERYGTGEPSLIQLGMGGGRWPQFEPVALVAGFRSEHALPTRLRGLPSTCQGRACV